MEIIVNPKAIFIPAELFGDEIVCTPTLFARSNPGYMGIALNTDSQSYSSKIFSKQANSPVLIRVLYYLDDLTNH